MGAALQRCHRDLTAERAASTEAAATAQAEAAEQAALVFRLSVVLQEHDQAMVDAGLKRTNQTLRVVCGQMLSALDGTGLTVVDPVGQPFDDVAEAVEVVGWRHGPEFHDEVVAETVEPIVRHGAEVVRLGRVVMGAPAQGRSSGEEDA
jgi:molecular chaperone GrpE (heat shock protein)